MISRNIQKHVAVLPLSRATANTTYNGQATVADAVGIPIESAENAFVSIALGVIGATSVAYSIALSNKSTGNASGDLKEVPDSELLVLPASANGQMLIEARLDRAAVELANGPIFLFVKRVQVGAVATLDSVTVTLQSFKEQPVLVKAGVAVADLAC